MEVLKKKIIVNIQGFLDKIKENKNLDFLF